MDQTATAHTFIPPTTEELDPLFPAYEIAGFIAAGGMGAVYHARQRSLDRPVAIKILPREFGADAQFRANFEAEAKAMARLNHPNLISVYDFGDIDGMLYIIMELVHGKSLYHSAHGVAIEQKEAARLGVGICRGLTHAHQAGILHRDIKPANILLTQEAQPKIGDFGLARPVGHEHSEDEAIYGTPGYSAPEVLNNPSAVDQRTDLFAVGVLLYELLTGRLPGDPWQPPSSLARMDPAFDNILRRATHPSPELRHADPNELGDELEAIIERLNTSTLSRPTAVPITNGVRPGNIKGVTSLAAKQSNAGAIAAVVVFLIALLGLLGVAMNQGGSDSPTTAMVNPTTPTNTVEVPERLLVTTSPEPAAHPNRPDRPKKNRLPKKPRNLPERNPNLLEEPIATIDPPSPEEIDPDPVPEPVFVPEPELPLFDTVAFIDKGRESLRSKATEIFDHNEGLHAKNIDRFERAAERIARRSDRDQRDEAEEYVESYFDTLRASNRVIPPSGKPPRAFEKDAASLREAFEEALAEQADIVVDLHSALQPLQESYSMGLNRQAAELNADGNTTAENILSEEADLAEESMIYFITILKGEEPHLEDEPEDEDKIPEEE